MANTRKTVCLACGATFTAKQDHGRWPKYCSRKCWSAGKSTPKDAKCEQCGSNFKSKKKGNRWTRFCSRECADKAKQLRGTCEHCGCEFHPTKQSQRFCSRKCYKESQGAFFTCPVCGKQFFRQNHMIERGVNTYCSVQCAGIDKRKEEPESVDVECEQCGKTYRIRRCEEKYRRFCSTQCAYMAARKPETEDFRCVVCGKRFTRSASMKKDGMVCCSMECRNKHQSIKVRQRTKTTTCDRCGVTFEYDSLVNTTRNSTRKYCSNECQRGTRNVFKCINCGTKYEKPHGISESSYCSRECQFAHQVGENAGKWSGGRILTSNDSINVATEEFYKGKTRPNTRRYRAEHRVIAETAIGRPLEKNGEPMIHLNGNNQDNRPENLYVFPNWVALGEWITGVTNTPTKSNLSDLANAQRELK